MLALSLLSILWATALAGWGSGLYALVRRRGSFSPDESFAFSVLLGHAPILAIGFFMHFWLPLSGWPAAFVLIGGWVLVARGRKLFLKRIPTLFILSVLGVALFASRSTMHGDSGLYHFQAVAWMAESPAVRGLANLHSCFGYNSSWWLLAAMMSWPFGMELGGAAVSIPLLASTGVLILSAAARAFRGTARGADWLLVPAFYLWLRQVVGVNNPAPATDAPANMLVILCIWSVAATLSPRRGISVAAELNRLAIPLTFAALAATVKASALILLLLLGLWTLWCLRLIWWNFFQSKRGFLTPDGLIRKSGTLWLRKFSLPAFVIFALLLGWIAHGLVLSGYPVWPSKAGAFGDLAWRVPGDVLDGNYVRARSWAFTYGADEQARATTAPWRLWLDGQSGRTNLSVAAGVVVVLFFGLIFGRQRIQIKSTLPLLVPMLIAVIGLVWNMAHAPALRFSSGYAFAALGCAAAMIGPALPTAWPRLLIVSWLALSGLALSKLALDRNPNFLWCERLPQTEHVKHKTISGDVIFFPVDYGLAWLGPRPSTPELNENLQLIRDRLSGRIVEFRVAHP